MRYRYYQIGFSFVLLALYSIIYYFILIQHQNLDFSSLYSTTYALLHDENPYGKLSTHYLDAYKLLPANLNPPFVLWFFSPLGRLTYSNALLIWSFMSQIWGLIGASIVFRYACSTQFLEKHFVHVYLLYLAFFATLMNSTTMQLGSLLFLLIMLGYHLYLKQRDVFAGILWGIIIAMKLFPGLLFFFVIKQKRYKVFWVMCLTFLIAWLIPLLAYGSIIYQYYHTMMSRVLWYGDGWNASLYGFLFRLFMKFDDWAHLRLFNFIYLFLFFGGLLVYLKKLGPTEIKPVNHQPFCLTLAMMLFLSPLGWLYYFSLLIFPLILTWFDAVHEKKPVIMFTWLLSLFLINFPLDYISSENMHYFLTQISFYSTYFYGLVLLIYLVARKQKLYGYNDLNAFEANHCFMPAIISIFVFGLSMPIICFVMRLFGHA